MTYDEIENIRLSTIRKRFSVWSSLLERLDDAPQEGTVVRFPNSSSYIFSTNGFHWAIDPVYTLDGLPCDETNFIAQRLKNLDFILVTHLHYDHFSLAAAKILGCEKTHWVLSKRCAERFLKETSFPAEKVTLLEDGETFTHNEVSISAFPGYHAEPQIGMNVPSGAFSAILPDGTKLFFPVDVRNYPTHPPRLHPDYVFGHVWLGRVKASGDFFPHLDDFAKFLLDTKPENIILAHLIEVSRHPDAMWFPRHAELVKKRIAELAPDVNVMIPQHGDILKLVKK